MTQPADALERLGRAQRATVLGLFVNTLLALVKLVAGWTGRSHALMADAIESLADTFGSLIVWGGMWVSAQPPDARHPYGHGKAEALAALFVSIMLIGAALGIAFEAVREILTPQHVPAAYTLWVLLGVVAIKETLYRVVRRVGTRIASSAVLADAWHHRADAITSTAAALGISIAIWGGPAYAAADDWAALLAAAIILINALRLMREPLHELMDAEPVELIAQVRDVALHVPGVRGVETLLARKHGACYRVDMHLEVDPDLTVREAHALAHRVKDAIREALPAVEDVLIHIEPWPQHAETAAGPTAREAQPR